MSDDNGINDFSLDDFDSRELADLERTARAAMSALSLRMEEAGGADTKTWPEGWPTAGSVVDDKNTADVNALQDVDELAETDDISEAGDVALEVANDGPTGIGDRDHDTEEESEPEVLGSYIAPELRNRRSRRFQLVGIAAALLLVALGGLALLQRGNDDSGVTGGDASVPPLEIGEWRTLPPAPLAGREGHSVVWTGEEMIVWGGAPDSSAEQNADDDSEAMEEGPLDSVDPPDSSSNFADGASYNPETDEWTTIAPLPGLGRSEHASAWTAEGMFIAGGVSEGLASGRTLRDAWLYRPELDDWLELPGLPAPMANRMVASQAKAVSNGRFIVVGGGGDPDRSTEVLLILDLTQPFAGWMETNTPLTDSGNALGIVGSASSGTGRERWVVLHDSLEIWVAPMPTAPEEDLAWRQINHPLVNVGAGFSLVEDRLVGALEFGTNTPPMVSLDLAAGGSATWVESRHSPEFGWLDQVGVGGDALVSWERKQVIDLARDELFELGPPEGFESRELPNGTPGVWTGEEVIYFGGQTPSFTLGNGESGPGRRVSLGFALPISRPGAPEPEPVAPIETEPEAEPGPLDVGEWRRLPEPPLAGREGHSAVWSGEEMIVWGGTPDTGDNSAGSDGETISEPNFADGAAYNPQADTWRLIEPAPFSGRSGHAATWTDAGLFVAGGQTEGHNNLCCDGPRDAWLYRPDSDDWLELPSLPERPTRSMAGSGTAAISNGRSVVVITSKQLHVLDPAADTASWTSIDSPLGAVSPQVLVGQATSGTGEEDWLVVHNGSSIWVSPTPESVASEISWRRLDGPHEALADQFWIGSSVLVGDRLVLSPRSQSGIPLAWIDLSGGASAQWVLSEHSPEAGFAAPVAIGGNAFLSGSTQSRAIIDLVTDDVIDVGDPDDRRVQSSFGHGIVWTGEDVILFGGRTASFDGSDQRRVTTGVAIGVERSDG